MIKIFFHIRLFISFEEIVVAKVLLTLDGKGRVHEAVGEFHEGERVQEQTVPRGAVVPLGELHRELMCKMVQVDSLGKNL